MHQILFLAARLAAAFVMRAGDVAPAGKSLAVPDRALLTLGLLAMLSLMIEGAVADWSGILLAQGGADIQSTTIGYGAFSCAMVVTAGYAGLLLGPVVIGSVATAASLSWGMALLAVAAAAVSMLAPRVCHGF